MAITYPLQLPIRPSAYSLEKRAVSTFTESPFTFQQYVAKGIGESFGLQLTFPPIVNTATARVVSAFGSALRGQYGTFEFPIHSRDLAYTGSADITLSSINNDLRNNITVSADVGLGVGTYIQIGTQLIQVLQVATGTTLDIFPALRQAYATGSAVNYKTPKGIFRLTSQSATLMFNSDHTYSTTVEALEAV